MIIIKLPNLEIQKEIVSGFFAVIGVVSPILLTYLLHNDKRKKNKQNLMKLKHHPVFVRIDAYKSYLSTGFTLENKGKQEVFKELLLGILQVRYDNLVELANEVESCEDTCDSKDKDGCNKLYNLNMRYLHKGVDARSEYFNSSKYSDSDRVILGIVLEKFNKWDENRTKHLESTLPLICSSNFYSDCHTRQAVIFDIYLGVIADMLNDAEKTLNGINGDLRGMVFKGITI